MPLSDADKAKLTADEAQVELDEAQLAKDSAHQKADIAALTTDKPVVVTPPPTPLNQVINLAADVSVAGKANLIWKAPATGVPTTYTVTRGGTDTTGAGAYTTTIPGTQTNFVFDKLLDGTSYPFTVTPSGASPLAANINATTKAATVTPTTPPIITTPIPTGSDPTPSQVLNWPTTAGAVPPSSLIQFDRLGGGGFGNGELETYTQSSSNIYLDGHGNLVIVAKADKTSARINLIPWGYIQPGSYWEIPAILPPNGWSAIWTIGKNATTVPWPSCGEGDLVEIQNGHALGNVHVGTSSNGDEESGWGYPTCDAGPVDGKTTDLWGMYFDANVVKYYRNRKMFMQWTAQQAAAKGGNFPFGQPHYVILNIAIQSGDNNFSGGTATFGGLKAWKGTLPTLT